MYLFNPALSASDFVSLRFPFKTKVALLANTGLLGAKARAMVTALPAGGAGCPLQLYHMSWETQAVGVSTSSISSRTFPPRTRPHIHPDCSRYR